MAHNRKGLTKIPGISESVSTVGRLALIETLSAVSRYVWTVAACFSVRSMMCMLYLLNDVSKRVK